MLESYTQFVERTGSADPLNSVKDYSDYARTELAKTGELTPEINESLTNDSFNKAIELGAIPNPESEEALQASFESFRKRPASTGLINIAARDLEDKGDSDSASKLRAFAAIQNPTIKSQYPDEASYAAALDNARAEAEPLFNEVDAKRYALKNGLAKVISYEQNGRVRVESDPSIEGINDSDLASYASAYSQFLQPDHLPAAKEKLTTIEGLGITGSKLDRKSELNAQLVALANSDKKFGDAITGVAGYLDDEARSTGQTATDALLRPIAAGIAGIAGMAQDIFGGKKYTPAPAKGPATSAINAISDSGLLSRYSKEEIADAVSDIATRKGIDNLEYDPANPASVSRILSDGSIAVPMRVLADKKLFDTVLPAINASKLQKDLLVRERGDRLDSIAQTMLPQLIEADGSILNLYNKQKAEGKSDGDILESLTTDHKYNGVLNRLESFGLATTHVLTDLIPAIGFVVPDALGGQAIRDAGFGIAKKLNTEQAANATLASLYGKDFGWGQQLVEQVPQLAADILISRGAGSAASAAGRASAASAAVLAPELTAKLARFSSVAVPELVGKEVATSIATKLSAVPNELGWLISQGARTFGSTYTNTRTSLEAQTKDDGTPKYTKDQIDAVATEAATSNALYSNAITLGFNHIFGGKLAGAETLAVGKGFSIKNLKSYYDDLQAGVRSLPADLQKSITLASFKEFTRDAVKASLHPVKEVLFGAAGEGFEEFAQTVAEDVVNSAATGENFDIAKTTQSAALAASFGAVLGGGAEAVSAAETRYLRDPAYTKADFEETYLKRTVDQLRAANSPATADFLEQQLGVARQRKQSIRDRFTDFNIEQAGIAEALKQAAAQPEGGAPLAPTGPSQKLLPAPIEGELLPEQRARVEQLTKHKARLERILEQASAVTDPTEAQVARINELQVLLARTDENIANASTAVPLSGEAGAPEAATPEAGPEVDGQFEMPFMNDWVGQESRTSDHLEEDADVQSTIDAAQTEFGFETGTEFAPSPQDLVFADISGSVPVAKLQKFRKSATPELVQEFSNAFELAIGTHEDIARYSAERDKLNAEIPAFEANVESLSNREQTTQSAQVLASYKQRLDKAKARLPEVEAELASLQEDRADITGRIKQLATKPADETASAVETILDILSAEAPVAEVKAKAAAKKAKGLRPSIETAVSNDVEVAAAEVAQQIVDAAGATAKPAETIAEAVAELKKRKAKAAPAVTEDQQLAEEIETRTVEMLEQIAAAPDIETGMAEIVEPVIERKFTAADAEQLLDSTETFEYKVKGKSKMIGKYLAGFSKPSDFLSQDDFDLFQRYLAEGNFPKSFFEQKQLLAYGGVPYVRPFFNTLQREIERRYPTIEAAPLEVNKQLAPEEIYNPTIGITVFRAASSVEKLLAAKTDIQSRIRNLEAAGPQSAEAAAEWKARYDRVKAEHDKINERAQKADTATHAALSLERESLREWLRATRPEKANELEWNVWENEAGPTRLRVVELDDQLTQLEAREPVLAELHDKAQELAQLRNEQPFEKREWRKRIKQASDELLRLETRIANYAKEGDLIIDRKTERGVRVKNEIDSTFRAKRNGEVELIKLPLARTEDGTLIGVHTNVPEDAARLRDHGFAVRVTPKQKKTLNPAIKVRKDGFIKSVTLPDGRVVSTAGDMRSFIETAYQAEENTEESIKFTFSLPPVPKSLGILMGANNTASGDAALSDAAYSYLFEARSSTLKDIRNRMLSQDQSYDDFCSAVLNRYIRSIREFSLAVRVRQARNKGQSVDKLMQRLFVVDGEIKPEVREALVRKYGENTDNLLLYTYASQLDNELGESFATELLEPDKLEAKDSKSDSLQLLPNPEGIEGGGRWASGRPQFISTLVRQVWTNFRKSGARRKVEWRSELPNEEILPSPLSQQEFDDVANIVPAMEAAFIESVTPFWTTVDVDFIPSPYFLDNNVQLHALKERTVSALKNPDVRSAFENMASAFGISDPQARSNDELVDLLRDEQSAIAQEAAKVTRALVKKESARLAKEAAAELRAKKGVRALKSFQKEEIAKQVAPVAEANVTSRQAALADTESRRVVSSYIKTLAEFSRAVEDKYADMQRRKEVTRLRAVDNKTYGRTPVSPETLALVEGTKSYVAPAIENPLIVQQDLAATTAADITPITLPDGQSYSRAQLKSVRDSLQEQVEAGAFSDAKSAQYTRFIAELDRLLSGRRKSYTTGNTNRDIPSVFYSKARSNADVARVVRENSIQASFLGLQSGMTDFTTAFANMPANLAPVTGLLSKHADVLRSVNVQLVTLPNTGWAGRYSPDSNTVFLNLAASDGFGIANVLTHELLHAVVFRTIADPQSAQAKMLVAKLDSLRAKALEAATASGETDPLLMAGLASVQEFVSYTMTSPDFQRMLNQTDSRGFLRRFIDAVIGLFTGRREPESVIAIRDIVTLAGHLNPRPYGTSLSESIVKEAGSATELLSKAQTFPDELKKMTLSDEERGKLSRINTAYFHELNHGATTLVNDILSDKLESLSGFGRSEKLSDSIATPVSEMWTAEVEGLLSKGKVDLRMWEEFADTYSREQVSSDPRFSSELSKVLREERTTELAEYDGVDVNEMARRITVARLRTKNPAVLAMDSLVHSYEFLHSGAVPMRDIDFINGGWENMSPDPSGLRNFKKALSHLTQWLEPAYRSEIKGVRDDALRVTKVFIEAFSDDIKRDRAAFDNTFLKGADLYSLAKPDPESVNVIYDSGLPMAFSSRSDSESVYINPDLLAETVAGLSERNAANLTRSLISHELAHIAAFKTLSESDITDIAATLPESRLLEVADRYYSATIADQQARAEQIVADRINGTLTDKALVHEFVRMEVEKSLTGFTSEQDASFYRRNPNILQKFARYLQAFINKLTDRISGVNDSRTAASLNRVIRAHKKLTAGDVVESADDAISKAAEQDTTFAYAMPVVGEVARSKWKKLFVSEASPAVKALLDEKGAYAAMSSRIALRFSQQMEKFRKSGLISDTDSPAIRAALGGHVEISRAKLRELRARFDDNAKLIEDRFAASAKTTAERNVYETERAQLNRDYDSWVDNEWAAADAKVRADMATAQSLLPAEVLAAVTDIRTAIDTESAKLANDPNLPDDLRAAISDNLGIYVTQTYRAFTQKGWTQMLRAGGVAQIGNEMVDFDAIKNNALKYFAERASDNLTAKYSKSPLTPSALKAKVASEVTDEAQRMFDAFIERYDQNAAGLTIINASPEEIYKALLEGSAGDPLIYKHAADSLKYGQNKYLARKTIPPFMRELLGEVTDPVEAALRTYTNVALLATNQKFLTDLKATGMEGGWLTYDKSEANAKGYVKIGSNPTPETVSILADVYGPEEFRDMIDGMFRKSVPLHEDEATKLVNKSIGFLRGAAGKAMAAKTLLSVGYYPRNALSDFAFFGPFQGIIIDAFNSARWKTAYRSSFTGADTSDAGPEGYENSEAYIRDLIRLGVLDNDANTTALKQTIGGLVTNPDETLRKLRDGVMDLNDANKLEAASKAVSGGAAKLLDKAARLSNTIGSHLKIAVYEHELANLTEAYGSEWTEEQIKKEAARKVGLTTQTRSNVAPVVSNFTKSGLGSIIGPFAVFRSEVFRITANTLKLAHEEIKSGNEVIRQRGKRRLTGAFVTTTILPTLLGGVVHALFGAFSDKEDDAYSEEALKDYFLPRSFAEIRRDKALRAGLPEWQQNNSVTFAVTGKKVRALDMTFINPFALELDPLMRSYEHIVNGDEDKIAETFARWAGQTLIGEQIAAGAVAEAFANRDDRGIPIAGEDLPFHQRVMKQTAYVLEQGFKPPVASFIWNEITGERGSRKPNSSEARNMNRLELAAGEAFGVRPRALDIETLAETAFRRSNSMLREVRTAAAVANSPYVVGSGEIAASVDRVNNARVARGEQVQLLTSELGKFIDTGRLISLAREAGMSKDSVKKAMAGYVDRYEMPKADLQTVFSQRQEADGTGKQALEETIKAITSYPKLIPLNND